MAEPDFSALWRAFRGEGGGARDRVVVGVAAAFLHVVAADDDVRDSEIQRFLDVVRGSRLASADDETSEELSNAFSALVAARFEAPDVARVECLKVLSELGLDPMRREIIWSAAQAALLADAELGPEERAAEREIRSALGLGTGARG